MLTFLAGLATGVVLMAVVCVRWLVRLERTGLELIKHEADRRAELHAAAIAVAFDYGAMKRAARDEVRS